MVKAKLQNLRSTPSWEKSKELNNNFDLKTSINQITDEGRNLPPNG
jgi:hypothetical protein